MYRLFEWYGSVREFIEMGGPVMLAIGMLTLLMWVLILERGIYYRTACRRLLGATRQTWNGRAERRSWHAHKVRRALISRASLSLNESLPLIQTLVALCPLLGLLGTVTGMIEVFEVMAFSGTGNPRSMAAGVSKATLPTMAGMVAALSGLFGCTLLSRFSRRQIEHLAADLTMEG